MAAPDFIQELKSVLDEFDTFLNDNRDKVKPAVAPLDLMTGGRVTELINMLVELMGKLKAEISKLDPNLVPGLEDVTKFTQSVTTLLQTSKNLLPDEADTIDDILAVANVVTGLESLEDLKQEIEQAIDRIIGHLQYLIS